MRFLFVALACLLFSGATFAEAPATTAKQHISYELRNLRPQSFSQYYLVGMFSLRQYLKFQNESGSHQFLYEESSVYSALPEIHDMQQAISIADYSCSVDVDCDAKAFCTNGCKDMYYELSNLPSALAVADVNHCRVTYFACQHDSGHSTVTVPETGSSP